MDKSNSDRSLFIPDYGDNPSQYMFESNYDAQEP